MGKKWEEFKNIVGITALFIFGILCLIWIWSSR